MTRTLDDLRSLYSSPEVAPAAAARVLAGARRAHERRRTHRRRVLVAGGATLALAGAGLGVASASGLVNQTMERLVGESTPGAYNAEAGTARVLTTSTAPDGEPLTLWYADASGDGYCVYALVGDAGTENPPLAALGPGAHPSQMAASCSGPRDSPDLDAFGYPFAGGGGGRTVSDGRVVSRDLNRLLVLRAPGAATVRLLSADGSLGQTFPVSEGWAAVAYTKSSPSEPAPTLIGYDASGAEIGRAALTD